MRGEQDHRTTDRICDRRRSINSRTRGIDKSWQYGQNTGSREFLRQQSQARKEVRIVINGKRRQDEANFKEVTEMKSGMVKVHQVHQKKEICSTR